MLKLVKGLKNPTSKGYTTLLTQPSLFGLNLNYCFYDSVENAKNPAFRICKNFMALTYFQIK